MPNHDWRRRKWELGRKFNPEIGPLAHREHAAQTACRAAIASELRIEEKGKRSLLRSGAEEEPSAPASFAARGRNMTRVHDAEHGGRRANAERHDSTANGVNPR